MTGLRSGCLRVLWLEGPEGRIKAPCPDELPWDMLGGPLLLDPGDPIEVAGASCRLSGSTGASPCTTWSVVAPASLDPMLVAGCTVGFPEEAEG